MSTANAQVDKKAVHVKWAGKTIALGTFPTAEADDKCARAKALTRAWRSTMRPKPTREWVMLELERLDVRVVSGRVAQKDSASDSDDGDDDNPASSQGASKKKNSSITTTQQQNQLAPASLLNTADIALGHDGRSSMGSIDSAFFYNRQGSLSGTTNLNPNLNTLGGNITAGEKNDIVIPHQRPYVGGGAAAAYEATREDYYRKVAERRNSQNKDEGTANGINHAVTNLSGSRGSFVGATLANDTAGLGALNQIGANVGDTNQQMSLPSSSMNLPSNANQHYEMLKLHHMNLLNEIQETTLMMNLYQQQHLQQQLQQEQLEKSRRAESQLTLLSQQQQMLAGAGAGGTGQNDESLRFASSIGQQNPSSQVGELVGNGIGLSHKTSTNANNGSGNQITNDYISNGNNNNNNMIANSTNPGNNNSNSMMNNSINGDVSINDIGINSTNNNNNMMSNSNNNNNNGNNGTDSNNINNNTSSRIDINANNITENSMNNPAVNPSPSLNNFNGESNKRRIDEVSAGNTRKLGHDDELQRIKDEIAERQRMVDELERMEPQQKQAKAE